MKVLLVNGSPHREGCTYTALCEVGDALNTCGVDTYVIWIGNRPPVRLYRLSQVRRAEPMCVPRRCQRLSGNRRGL